MKHLFKSLTGLFLVCLLASCSSNKVPAPEKIVPLNTMKELVWDMLRADEYFLRKTQFDTLHKMDHENIRLYEQVFQAHGVDRKTFYNSWKWCQSHPVVFQTLLDSVDAVGTRQRNEANRRFGRPQ